MIGGSVPQPQRLKSADLAKLPRASVKAKDHNGKESMFEGIALVELLKLAGLQFDEALLGKKLEDFSGGGSGQRLPRSLCFARTRSSL
jgi:hypothetical protein